MSIPWVAFQRPHIVWPGEMVVPRPVKVRLRCGLLAAAFFFIMMGHSAPAPGAELTDSTARLHAMVAPLDGWILTGIPETAFGEALFSLINGGAEYYLNLGFDRAVFAGFKGDDGTLVHVEVFMMTSPSAAEKAYAGKVGSDGTPVSVGIDARLEGHYLNFRTGPFLVTVSGYRGDPKTVDGILTIARSVNRRLEAFSAPIE